MHCIGLLSARLQQTYKRLTTLQVQITYGTTSLFLPSLCSDSYLGCQHETARSCCRSPCCGAVAAVRRARRCQSIAHARTALSSKHAARRYCGRMTGQTDRHPTVSYTSALGVLNDYALYKSTQSLAHNSGSVDKCLCQQSYNKVPKQDWYSMQTQPSLIQHFVCNSRAVSRLSFSPGLYDRCLKQAAN